jgi:phosphopantothenoylcysteine decarboxylase / phosphopantothenate---cysteine ligase
MQLEGKKILLGITGSIAAYKIPFLVRLLIKEGAEVQVIVTPAAKDFVTPLTLSTLSKNTVLCEGFSQSDGKWNSHIELGNWADAYLIAPVTANTLAKMAGGFADNLLMATYLAAKCPVFFAPAMDLDMYKHQSTQKNVETICSYGNHLISPNEGELASGLCGAGRMEEPERIIEILAGYFSKKKDFDKKHVLVTAGPTFESIDPVRYLGNQSSGLMGFEIAKEFADLGALVTLITGPVNLETNHPRIHRIDVVTANQMNEACLKHFKKADITIMAAAVADYMPKKTEKHKIKKNTATLTLELTKTPDILQNLGKIKTRKQILVGFALETDNETENAKHKLINKNLDLIVLNSLKDLGAGFKSKNNKITIISKNSGPKVFALKPKNEVAKDIANEILEFIKIGL